MMFMISAVRLCHRPGAADDPANGRLVGVGDRAPKRRSWLPGDARPERLAVGKQGLRRSCRRSAPCRRHRAARVDGQAAIFERSCQSCRRAPCEADGIHHAGSCDRPDFHGALKTARSVAVLRDGRLIQMVSRPAEAWGPADPEVLQHPLATNHGRGAVSDRGDSQDAGLAEHAAADAASGSSMRASPNRECLRDIVPGQPVIDEGVGGIQTWRPGVLAQDAGEQHLRLLGLARRRGCQTRIVGVTTSRS